MTVVRIGVSACLLGQLVRYNGGHQRDAFLLERVGRIMELVPVCPEVEVGLGVPRETLRLVRRKDEPQPRLLAPASGRDHSSRMRTYARRRVRELAVLDLSGYVLKRGSPSCGLERVRRYDDAGTVRDAQGRGLFAQILVEELPLLPLEEDGRLHDARLRESFFERVFAYRRLRDFFASPWTVGDLVGFHAREKLLLLAHEPAAYRELGRLVAAAKYRDADELADDYMRRFMRALAQEATPGKNANVLEHMAGYLRGRIDGREREQLHELTREYREGLVPLDVPLAVLRHHIEHHRLEYLRRQHYLQPHPRPLGLRGRL